MPQPVENTSTMPNFFYYPTGMPLRGQKHVVSIFAPKTKHFYFTPSYFDEIHLSITAPSMFATTTIVIDSIVKDSISFTPELVITKVCDEGVYEYGFNGQMKTNEWAGVGNHYEFRYRGYDPRVARFGSIDPLTKQYPWYTPYQFAGNSPIKFIDIEGAEECSADAAQMRLQTGYLKGTVTEKQLKEQAQAQAAGATAGLVALFDIYVTKGKISSYLWSSYLWGTQNHTESKNPTVANQQRTETRNGVVAGVTGYAFGKLAGYGLSFLASTADVFMDAAAIRFSQRSVSGYGEVYNSMRINGWVGDPIDIVMMEDGAYTTMDNTRLAAAQELKIEAKVRQHSYDEPLPEEMLERFKGRGKNGSDPTTWEKRWKAEYKIKGKNFRRIILMDLQHHLKNKIKYMKYLLEEGLPEGFKYPEEFIRIVDQGITNLTTWKILGNDLLTVRYKGVKARYPDRNLIPFSQRIDCDDIACFDANNIGCVVIIHDFASKGWEQRKIFNSFWDWFKSAINDMVEYDY